MKHCVGSFTERVANQGVFIYRMETPQRLTIALKPQGNKWRISEVRSYNNAPPIEEALAEARAWLESAND